MVGIQYQFGKDETIKLLNNIISAIQYDQIKLMDVELQSIGIMSVEFHCYNCGYVGVHTFTHDDDISEFCPMCKKVMNISKI